MKKIKVIEEKMYCKFCNSEMKISHRSYLVNPFCNECYEDRLENKGSIDLRNNRRVIDLGNDYGRIEPIDPTKKFKKTKIEDNNNENN